MSKWENNEEIQIFREYLQIPTVHPNVDYDACVEFLKRQANSLGLPVQVHYPATPKYPVVVMIWEGLEPNLPSIILNSHMDVVPVYPEMWTHPPFSAHIDADGKIYARGSQDMKCVGMQYLAAIRALKAKNFKPKRTVYITFVPEEEIGGHLGMEDFVKTKEFKQMNVGFSLDEGIASPNEVYPVYYAERTLWHVVFRITGTAGHGSLLLKNTVGEKLNYLVQKMFEFRRHELNRLESDPNTTIGDVTTINLTKMNGGVQANVVPPLMELTFDIRIAITVDHNDLENQFRKWCEEAGGDIEIIFEQKMPEISPTKIDNTNPYWTAFKQTVDDLGLKIRPVVFPGATDSRYVRELGIPAIGFSPMNFTPVLLHDHDEYLKADTYLNGIDIYKKLIPALSNV